VAAGSSERMGADKMLMTLGAKPVIIRTLMAFQQSPMVDDIVVVTKAEKIMGLADMIKLYDISKVTQVISGGATRMESALAGVSAVRKGAKLVAIHDGARPLVTQDLIRRVVEAANEYIAAVPAIRCVDTMKQVDGNGVITGALDRDSVVRVQTPQVFDADVIKGALTKAVEKNLPLTDDCSAMDMMGVKTHVVEGDAGNIKLTEPADMILAEAILKSRGE
ncbi:MAG: 2-C-methyl-D-erythritol 4-phosphate cytidylyltransferase, partial [Candidatus Limivicinus sp.]